MNTRLFRSCSVQVRISLVPYKYVPIYMCIVKDTYYICTTVKIHDSYSLESSKKYIMFELLLSIRVSFSLIRVGRMPRSCAATILFLRGPDELIFSVITGREKWRPVLRFQCSSPMVMAFPGRPSLANEIAAMVQR